MLISKNRAIFALVVREESGTNRHRINGFHHTIYNALSAPLTLADGAFLMPLHLK